MPPAAALAGGADPDAHPPPLHRAVTSSAASSSRSCSCSSTSSSTSRPCTLSSSSGARNTRWTRPTLPSLPRAPSHHCFTPPDAPGEAAWGAGGDRVRPRSHSDAEARPHVHRFSPRRFLVLGASVAAVFAVALGPFLVGDVAGHGRQLLSRLFPFQRGLCHAYWAPNLWAFYSALDRVSLLALSRAGIALPGASASSSATTSGLVADAAPAVLPAVRPQATMVLTLVAMAVRTPRAAAGEGICWGTQMSSPPPALFPPACPRRRVATAPPPRLRHRSRLLLGLLLHAGMARAREGHFDGASPRRVSGPLPPPCELALP